MNAMYICFGLFVFTMMYSDLPFAHLSLDRVFPQHPFKCQYQKLDAVVTLDGCNSWQNEIYENLLTFSVRVRARNFLRNCIQHFANGLIQCWEILQIQIFDILEKKGSKIVLVFKGPVNPPVLILLRSVIQHFAYL